MSDLNDQVKWYPNLIELTYKVIQSFKGVSLDGRYIRCHDLATKLFFHAATINQIRFGTNLFLSEFKDTKANIIDFPSITILTRASLDTYLKMFEVFFEPRSEEEFEYRFAVYQLGGFVIRETHIPKNPEPLVQIRVEQSLINIDDMRTRIKKTSFYKKLDKNQQKQSLSGKIMPKRSWEDLAIKAGFGQKFVSKVYAYQSAYVHSDSLSTTQLVQARNDEERLSYVNPSIGMMMMIISKMLNNYSDKFEQARNEINSYPDGLILVTALSKAASNME